MIYILSVFLGALEIKSKILINTDLKRSLTFLKYCDWTSDQN